MAGLKAYLVICSVLIAWPFWGRGGLANDFQMDTAVLDNARYQRNKIVEGLAKELRVELLFLPSDSPNLNLIERLWRFVKRKAAYGRYHPTFAEFRAAIEDVLDAGEAEGLAHDQGPPSSPSCCWFW